MDEMELEEPVMRTATFGTEGCENRGVPVTNLMVTTIVCGGCGEYITDVEEV